MTQKREPLVFCGDRLVSGGAHACRVAVSVLPGKHLAAKGQIRQTQTNHSGDAHGTDKCREQNKYGEDNPPDALFESSGFHFVEAAKTIDESTYENGDQQSNRTPGCRGSQFIHLSQYCTVTT